MNRTGPTLLLSLALAGCAAPPGPQPSLAHRPAEAIDPRVPVPSDVPVGQADAALVAKLDALVAQARAGTAEFDQRASVAQSLAASAGPQASESWVAAEAALSRLVAQYGVTTRAAADIDEIAGVKLKGQRWIAPADQQAISAAQASVAAISGPQGDLIGRLTAQLDR